MSSQPDKMIIKLSENGNLSVSLKSLSLKIKHSDSCVFIDYVFSTDALMEYTNGEYIITGQNATAGIFASYPAKHLSVLNGFVDQVRLKANMMF